MNFSDGLSKKSDRTDDNVVMSSQCFDRMISTICEGLECKTKVDILKRLVLSSQYVDRSLVMTVLDIEDLKEEGDKSEKV